MTLIMDAVFVIFLIFMKSGSMGMTRIVFMVDVIAELLVKSANLVGSGNLMLVAKILPVDRVTRMLKSWFSVARS